MSGEIREVNAMVVLVMLCALFAIIAATYGFACDIQRLFALKHASDVLRINEGTRRTAYRTRAIATLCDKREAQSNAWRKRARALLRESKLAYLCALANAALIVLMK